MKAVGWIYLFASLVDCGLSIAAQLVPSLSDLSDAVSGPMVLGAVVFFVLGATGLLRPRHVFLLLPLFYVGAVAYWAAYAAAEAIGKHNREVRDLYAVLHRWDKHVEWTLLAVWLALSAYGLVSYFRAQVPRPGEAPAAS